MSKLHKILKWILMIHYFTDRNGWCTASEPTSTEPLSTEPASTECVRIDGLPSGRRDWSTDWELNGESNGHPAYQILGESSSKYWLCYSTIRVYTYTISKWKCSGKLYAYCNEEVDDVRECTNWKVRSFVNIRDVSSVNIDDITCGDVEENKTIVVILIIVVIVVIAMFGVLYCCYRRTKNNGISKEPFVNCVHAILNLLIVPKNDTETQEMKNMESVQTEITDIEEKVEETILCTQCQQNKAKSEGRVDEGDGCWYCTHCWAQFEDSHY